MSGWSLINSTSCSDSISSRRSLTNSTTSSSVLAFFLASGVANRRRFFSFRRHASFLFRSSLSFFSSASFSSAVSSLPPCGACGGCRSTDIAPGIMVM